MLVECALVHIVVGMQLGKSVEKHPVWSINCAESLESTMRVLSARVIIDAGRSSVSRPANDNVTKMHVLGRVV